MTSICVSEHSLQRVEDEEMEPTRLFRVVVRVSFFDNPSIFADNKPNHSFHSNQCRVGLSLFRLILSDYFFLGDKAAPFRLRNKRF